MSKTKTDSAKSAKTVEEVRPMTRRDHIIRELNAASNMVKVSVGIGNNAAWAACLDAIDIVKKHPRFHTRIKGNTTPGAQFMRAFKMLHQYERALVWDDTYRFFHVADMPPQTRAIYGDISDRDYYDFWAAFGFTAYQRTGAFFTSLVNKIRLAYLHHGDEHPEIMAWAVGAGACLDLAVTIYDAAIGNILEDCKYTSAAAVKRIFRKFSLADVAEQWCKAVNLLNPLADFKPDDTDQKNISAGYDQLGQMWMDENTLFGSRIETAKDYAEVFRTNGQMKKVMREFAELRDEFVKFKNE